MSNSSLEKAFSKCKYPSPKTQTFLVNMVARACAKRNGYKKKKKKDYDNETKDYIPERESKCSSESDYDSNECNSYSDWDKYKQNEEEKENEEETNVNMDIVEISDDDPSSDYFPSEDEDEDTDIDEKDIIFDETVYKILKSMKYNEKIKSTYLFDWGAEYWYMLENNKALYRNENTFKRLIENKVEWVDIIKTTQNCVIRERLD